MLLMLRAFFPRSEIPIDRDADFRAQLIVRHAARHVEISLIAEAIDAVAVRGDPFAKELAAASLAPSRIGAFPTSHRSRGWRSRALPTARASSRR
jgi:hypothetical protein